MAANKQIMTHFTGKLTAVRQQKRGWSNEFWLPMPKKYPGKIYVFYTTRETSASWGSGCSDFTNFLKKILVDVNKTSIQDIKDFFTNI